MENFPTTLNEFLIWLGSPLAAGWIISTLLEQWALFQNFTPDVKRLVTLIITVGLPVVSLVLRTNLPAETIAQLAPIFEAVAVGFVTWAGSQAVHAVQKRLE